MFKPFLSYMEEYEKKTYNFRIKIANYELTEEVVDKIKHALNRYDLVEMGDLNRLPLRTTDESFPYFRTPEIVQFDVSLKYPCIPEEVKETLAYQARIPQASVVVIRQSMIEDEENMLTDEIEDAQDYVGENRLNKLKELKKRKYDFSDKSLADQKAETTNDLEVGKLGPVSGKVHDSLTKKYDNKDATNSPLTASPRRKANAK